MRIRILVLLLSLLISSISSAIYFGVIPPKDSQIVTSTVILIDKKYEVCSGVIVGYSTIATAAHCVEDLIDYANDKDALKVYFPAYAEHVKHLEFLDPGRLRGINPGNVIRTARRNQLVPVEKFGTVPDTRKASSPDDVALITIEGGLFNSDGQLVDTPMYHPANTIGLKDTIFDKYVVAGFGYDEGSGYNTERGYGILKSGEMKDSGVDYSNFNLFDLIPLGSSATRTCHGDSGGPIFSIIDFEDSSGTSVKKQVLVGLLSYIYKKTSDPQLSQKEKAYTDGDKNALTPYERCLFDGTVGVDLRGYMNLFKIASQRDPSIIIR